ncbi:hypothetical protein P43SY_001155 [Pythium insidiosum]|uniref:Uncharacterized protein n=1 Tax=Pythium insidiosum TaxID=114742 RepID=A0AAD5Q3M3_PYTIN|nr:hypothetical protein P43SY_001155 [Pythium insidiosum]
MRQRPPIQELCRRLYKSDSQFGLLYSHLSSDEDLRNAILFECHDSAAMGHPGTQKTLAAAQSKFYWLRMVKTIERYVRSCELCQRVKASQRKPAGLLHPLEVPHKRWSHISLDFMPDLPRTKQGAHDTILVILDRLTKRAHFVPTVKTASAPAVAKIFLREHVRLHGFPTSIVSDRDSRFLSAFWKALTSSQNTQINANDWDELLPMAEFSYNARHHSSIGMSPFAADLGYEPRAFADLALRPPHAPADAMRFLDHQDATLSRCRDALVKAQAAMKDFFDRNRPDVTFSVGDRVLLDTLHLDLVHVGARGRRKLAPRFIGPYTITARTTPNTYRLGLPPGTRLHDEFHVAYLRAYKEDTNPRRLNDVPKLITRDGYIGNQVRAIVGHRDRTGERQYKVNWYGRDVSDSWEPASNLVQAAGLIDEYLTTAAVTTTKSVVRQDERTGRQVRENVPSTYDLKFCFQMAACEPPARHQVYVPRVMKVHNLVTLRNERNDGANLTILKLNSQSTPIF